MGALLTIFQLRTEDDPRGYFQSRIKHAWHAWRKGGQQVPHCLPSSCPRMHQCHCHLNRFCFFPHSFFAFGGIGIGNTPKHRHVILTNYFDLEIFLRSRHLSFRCSPPVSLSFFFEAPRNCRISRILPIIDREGRKGEERDAQTIRFPPERGVSLTITKSDATEEEEEETKTKHLNDGKMSTDSGGICLLW